MPDTILIHEENNLMTITLNRAEVHNAFNDDVIWELQEIFEDIARRENAPRAVILTGSARSFSAGADLNWMKKMVAFSEEENREDSERLFDMIHSIYTCPVPVIARINGAALGGGCGLIAACDIAFSVKRAKFGFTEVRLGLVPAVISPFVREKIGIANCSRYFLTGQRFDAVTAQRIGLVNEVFEDPEEMDQAIDDLVYELTQCAPEALAQCKVLIQGVSSKPVGELREFVASQIAKARVSSHGQEGMASFFEKRKPNWT